MKIETVEQLAAVLDEMHEDSMIQVYDVVEFMPRFVAFAMDHESPRGMTKERADELADGLLEKLEPLTHTQVKTLERALSAVGQALGSMYHVVQTRHAKFHATDDSDDIAKLLKQVFGAENVKELDISSIPRPKQNPYIN